MNVPQLFPAGHFYSPVVDPSTITSYLAQLRSGDFNEVRDVELHLADQLELITKLKVSVGKWRTGSLRLVGGARYQPDNDQYGPGDAACFAGIIGYLQPTRIIEVGSGWSSALALDASEALGVAVQHTFIEPYPDRLHLALRPADRKRVVIHEQPVQEIPLDLFETLEANDILFIDSTHVYKPGSDVQYLFNHILPVLKDGVFVHIHDMFFPFEYPASWILAGRNWNELYMVRMLLQNSNRYSVRFWNHYLVSTQHAIATAAIPELAINAGGGLWFAVKN
jgi:Methyltransferase domain